MVNLVSFDQSEKEPAPIVTIVFGMVRFSIASFVAKALSLIAVRPAPNWERSDIGVVAEGSVTQRGNVVGQGECRQAAVGESTIAEGCHARTNVRVAAGTAFEALAPIV